MVHKVRLQKTQEKYGMFCCEKHQMKIALYYLCMYVVNILFPRDLILKYSIIITIIANKDIVIIANTALEYLNGAWYHLATCICVIIISNCVKDC